MTELPEVKQARDMGQLLERSLSHANDISAMKEALQNLTLEMQHLNGTLIEMRAAWKWGWRAAVFVGGVSGYLASILGSRAHS